MKTLRFHLPVLASGDLDGYLGLVTEVEGVVAALVDHARARLEVVVRSDASALLVREQLEDALLAGWTAAGA